MSMLSLDRREKKYMSYQARYNKAFASSDYVCYEKAIFFNNFEVCINNSSYGQSYKTIRLS